jgi:hypothetical protein
MSSLRQRKWNVTKHLNAISFFAAATVTTLLAACTGSTGGPPPPPITSQSSSTLPPESPSPLPDAIATATSTVATIHHDDTVLCNTTAGIPGKGLFSGTITISRWVSPKAPPETIYSLSLDRSFPGWTGGGASCQGAATWSADFSKLLVSGTPPNASSSHIAVVDLRTGTVRDLTAPRQRTGFSAPVLNETDPQFLSDTPSDRVTFGSNVVAFLGSGALSELDLRSPEVLKPLKTTVVAGQKVLPGHPEYLMNDIPITVDYNKASPDGSFLVDQGSSVASIAPAAHIDKVRNVTCSNVDPYMDSSIIGWADSMHAILVGHSVAKGDSAVDLVTVGLAFRCKSLIPATDKEISEIRLSPDRSLIFFTADGPDGPHVYSVPTTGKPREPTPDSYPLLPSETWFYYAGNY